jgi:hypothetical protein
VPDRSPDLQAAITAGLAVLTRELPAVIEFSPIADDPDGRHRAAFQARFSRAPERMLRILAVQRPTIRGFTIDNLLVEHIDGGLVVTATLTSGTRGS